MAVQVTRSVFHRPTCFGPGRRFANFVWLLQRSHGVSQTIPSAKGTLKSVSRTLAHFGQWKVIAPPVYHKHSHSPVIPKLRPTSPPKITATSHDKTSKRVIAYLTHLPETGLIIPQGKAYHTIILGYYVTFIVIFHNTIVWNATVKPGPTTTSTATMTSMKASQCSTRTHGVDMSYSVNSFSVVI